VKYEQLRKLIQAFSEPYRGTVYHYTTANGVAGIVGSHEIWMSNTAFTNDITELKMLQNPQNVLKGSDFTNDFVRQEWDKQRFREDGKNNYYMASFSRRKDSLEQWRAYGNFCIGFDARRLIVKKRVYLY